MPTSILSLSMVVGVSLFTSLLSCTFNGHFGVTATNEIGIEHAANSFCPP